MVIIFFCPVSSSESTCQITDFLMFRNHLIFSLSVLMGSSYLFVLEENACDALSLGKASFHTYSHQESLALLRSHRFTPASPSKDGCAGCAEGRGFGTRVWYGANVACG